MKVKVYGCRGSAPVSNPKSMNFGGNTTCLRVMSDCIPKGTAIVIDAGTGFLPLSQDLLQEEWIKEVIVLFTHYHHDHTQGIFLSPLTFMKDIKLSLFGPFQLGVDPKKMMEDLMKPPYFPIHFKRIGSHIKSKGFEFPETQVILIHPQGGSKILAVVEYEHLLNDGKFLPIGKGKYPINECLVITMYKSNHPEETISYRFEERTTRKTFVLLTDHENQSALPQSLWRHLQDSDLLIMDSQYCQKRYEAETAGYGHGTPEYCTKIAEQVKAKKLGLTHHDPNSEDADIFAIFEEAKASVNNKNIEIFPCYDYQEIEV